MGSMARKMKRREDKPNTKEQIKQARLAAQADVLAKQLNHKIDKDIYRAEVNALYKMTVITNWVLHNEWGFGKGRMQKFQDRMAHLCSCIHDPACDISVEGLNQTLKEETGYDTIWSLNNRRYNERAEAEEK